MMSIYAHVVVITLALWFVLEVLGPHWGGRPKFPRWQLFKAHVKVNHAARNVERAMRKSWKMRAGE